MSSSLEKGLSVLRELGRSDPCGVGVRELARRLTLQPSRVHALLKGLCRQGFARASEGGSYQLGPAALTLALNCPHLRVLQGCAESAVEELFSAIEETSAAVGWIDGSATVLAKRESRHQLIATMPSGVVKEPHRWASGLALLALCDAAERKRYASRAGVTVAQLGRLLARHTRRGYTEVSNVDGSGVTALAVPVVPLRIALAVCGPVERLAGARRKAVLSLLQTVAHRLTTEERGRGDE